jgi:hypothetical protein
MTPGIDLAKERGQNQENKEKERYHENQIDVFWIREVGCMCNDVLSDQRGRGSAVENQNSHQQQGQSTALAHRL